MPKNSRVALAMLLPAVSMLALFACGGDDSGAPNDAGGGSDASTSDAFSGDTGSSDSSAAPQAKANDVDVYVTQVANLDGTASTPSGATFSWQLASAPAGSAVTTASIANPATATPSLMTDVIGTYVLTLKVTSGGSSATKNVNVRAFGGKAFFGHSTSFDGGATSDVRFATIGSGSDGGTSVSCATNYMLQNGSPTNEPFAEVSIPGTLDWQEGAPAADPKVVFGFREVDPNDGGFVNYLASGTGSSTCATIQKLDPMVNTGNVPLGSRISPDGNRVAFIRDDGSGTPSVATIGLDGSNLRVLGPLFLESDGGVGPTPGDVSKQRVQWVDQTHVAWVVQDVETNATFSIYEASDTATPAAASIMNCAAPQNAPFTTQEFITEFLVLANGNILVRGNLTDDDSGTGSILVMHADTTTKQCAIIGKIGTQANDFALSPDGTLLAFNMPDVDSGITGIYVAPLDGGSPTAITFGDGGLPSQPGNGPRWIAGGTALLFGESGAFVDGGSTSNVLALNVAGGPTQVVATSSSSSEGFFGIGNLWSCSMSTAGGSTPFFGVFVSLGLLAARRRRKKHGVD